MMSSYLGGSDENVLWGLSVVRLSGFSLNLGLVMFKSSVLVTLLISCELWGLILLLRPSFLLLALVGELINLSKLLNIWLSFVKPALTPGEDEFNCGAFSGGANVGALVKLKC